MANTVTNQEREMRVAVERVIGFAQEFGEAHLNLACHAAFPLSLTPDLLYQIWANFVPEAPWTAVARVLLSRLCKEVGSEMYEMDNAVRNLLLRELKVQFGQERFDSLGDFLLEYVSQRLIEDDPDTQDLRQAQEWNSLAYTKPEQAARELAQALSDKVQQEDIGEVLSLSSWVETLSEPLVEAGFEPLLVYGQGIKSYFCGDLASAKQQLDAIQTTNNKSDIAGLNLYIPNLYFSNPFNHLAGRIDDPKLVFGRDREVNRIFELLNFGSSVAIIGETEIGKSSLLTLVEYQASIKLNSPRKPIYLNLGNVYDEEDFYFALCDLVGIPLCKGFRLSRELKKHKLLLILDNVENMAWDGFTNQIRSQIRALAEGNDAALRLLIAANKPLNCLFSDSSMVSPFENICLEEPLMPWQEPVIKDFIKTRLQNNPITFTELEISKIISDTKGYPQQVMRFCYQLYQQKCNE